MKIGIVSMYHGSRNYGGLLQAFALCKYLEQKGYEPEEIDIKPKAEKRLNRILDEVRKAPIATICKYLIKTFKTIYYRVIESIFSKDKFGTEKRISSIDNFRIKSIPHTEPIPIDELLIYTNKYDAFICGSDQIWNPYAYNDAYNLSFVDKNKPRIAYAVSLGTAKLSDEYLRQLAQHADELTAVTVREYRSKEKLGELMKNPVTISLDPTMLLDKDEWDKYIPARNKDEDYVFCYFLEKSREKNSFAKKFAKDLGLNLYQIPQVDFKCEFVDTILSGKHIYPNTPLEFISIIKNSKYVLTDSFHAVVFSTIYEKQFYCFECEKTNTLLYRAEYILDLFNCKDRYFQNVKEFYKQKGLFSGDIDYTFGKEKFKEEKIGSCNFLLNNLSREKREIEQV